MIVKNEAHLIVNTFKHLARYIKFDYWAINDNGSTDGTQDLIRNYFAEAGIPGVLDETPWRDFAYNRTVAFQAAFGKTDYAFVWDADDEIAGDFKLPENLTADSYLFTYGNAGGTRYSRCQLFNNSLRWKYVGVLHEFPAADETPGAAPRSQDRIDGNYYFISGRTGARNRDPDKYLKDALILEAAFNEAVEQKDGLLHRYAFYTAQSYTSCGRHEKAIEYYKKVLALDNWAQEKYISCLEIYDQYVALKREDEGLPYLVDSFRYDSKRVEGMYRLIKYYCIKGMPEVALTYYTLIQNYFENEYAADNIASRLFAKKEEYDMYLPYYMIIVSERLKRFDIFKKMYEIIFRQSYLHAGAWWIHNLFFNLQFGIPTQDPAFVEAMLVYVEKLKRQGITLNTDHYEILDRVVAASRASLAAPIQVPARPNNSPVRVMLTITTCKRLALFKDTINSMIRTWRDLSAVDYFFCVDDNSSADDRLVMQTDYPFFDYYMKEPAEKGHRESMNIIWNKLREIQPTYWIHMEDDWLYFKQESYVSRGIAFLEKYESQNIHQLVFNREYGLMLKDMNRTSVEPLESGVVLHSQTEVEGPNCAYWPHYSIQPSIIRTRVILELGNYDSPNTFFERDYANKYGAAGYKTMFFDGIYSFHIGKQHWEKTGMNAYALNAVGQFVGPSNPQLIISEIPKNEPLQGTMSEHLDQIIAKITTGLPFGLIRPSDGEHTILSNTTLTNCDHWTFTAGGQLQQQLMSAIQTIDPNLYIGIPCNTCNLPWNCTQAVYDDYTIRWGVQKNRQTYANIFGNSNWPRWSDFLKGYAKGFYAVTSGQHESPLQIKERFLIDEKLVDRWDQDGSAETDRLLRFVADKHGELICFSAGPLSKVWIPQCMKLNPSNMYVDAGASIDIFTKGATNRLYTTPNGKFANDICHFSFRPRAKNLVYFSVFHNRDYFRLADLLMKSLRLYSSTNAFDVLILTSPNFANEIKALGAMFVHYLPLTTIFEAACARLQIFTYPHIAQYDKILYLDTDIIIKQNLAPIFDLEIGDLLYGIESGTIESLSFGSQFFGDGVDKTTTGINSGTLLFKNCAAIQSLFERIRDHINTFTEAPPYCMDQPFINYHAIKDRLYDNQLLKPFVSLYEDKEIPTNVATSTVCHFSFPIGNANHKYERMAAFFRDILTTVCSAEPISVQGRTYLWDIHGGWIKFCADGILDTRWGRGVYYQIGPNRVRADWNNHFHVLTFSADSCTSIRIQPLDFSELVLVKS
jgi:tetratricopeptide (TPR) repeat protein